MPEISTPQQAIGKVDEAHATTLRTSIIGEDWPAAWLVGCSCRRKARQGFTRAIFSACLPSRSRADPRSRAAAACAACLYHVSAAAISKYDLLRLVARL